MKPNQNKIYFLTGESVDKIKSSPQLEVFLQKNIEVLYLTDAVDEFWVTVAILFKKKEFQSINRSDVDFENIDKEKDEKAVDEEDQKSKDADLKDVTGSQFESLTKFMKNILGEKIKEVRISKKLTDSPVCLAIDSMSMDIRLERFLLEQKQINSATAKIFEINPNNQIIKNLNQDHLDESKQEKVRDTIFSLFDLACIIEDEPIKDTKDFSRRIQNLMNFN
jgi:molecular chaperone HtpG